ncbi:MAG: 30S ribosomal protein S6 [Desulfobacterales bacterium]|nr:30S ribosomal protein S6 [Desulfobacterales bacterium]
MRRYETFIIIDPDLSEEQRLPVLERVKEIMAQLSGFLIRIDDWGSRKLSYAVKKKERGYYVRFDFCGTGQLVNEMERFFRIDERVLKHMSVLLDHAAWTWSASRRKWPRPRKRRKSRRNRTGRHHRGCCRSQPHRSPSSRLPPPKPPNRPNPCTPSRRPNPCPHPPTETPGRPTGGVKRKARVFHRRKVCRFLRGQQHRHRLQGSDACCGTSSPSAARSFSSGSRAAAPRHQRTLTHADQARPDDRALLPLCRVHGPGLKHAGADAHPGRLDRFFGPCRTGNMRTDIVTGAVITCLAGRRLHAGSDGRR